MGFIMNVDEVAEKFGFEIKEVKSGYYKVLNPRETSITEFGGCFNKCALVYTDEVNIVDGHNCITDRRGVFTILYPILRCGA